MCWCESCIQVLVRLCSHTAPAEELARKDDLTLLFSAITSSCPQYNVMWRKSAAEVLMTLSRHGLTQPVVSYIHSKCFNPLKPHFCVLPVNLSLSACVTVPGQLLHKHFPWKARIHEYASKRLPFSSPLKISPITVIFFSLPGFLHDLYCVTDSYLFIMLKVNTQSRVQKIL